MTTKTEIKAMTLKAKKALYGKAKEAYYNSEDGKTVLSDSVFDYLEDLIRDEDPEWVGLKKTGKKVGKKVEVQLDVPCPSLEKITHDAASKFERWKQNISKLHTHAHLGRKLDGSALQGTWIDGKLTRLRTRGDGVMGKDISYFIPYVNLPRSLKGVPAKFVVRFEAVMKRSVYEARWATEFDSARALASAVFNRQDVHESMSDVDLVALKIQHPVTAPAVGMTKLSELGFLTPVAGRVPLDRLTLEKLITYTINSKADSDYDMDGVVIQSGSEDPKHFIDTSDKPKLAKAFKVNTEADDAVETVITGMVIKASSFGVLVPKATIKPVKIGDVTVTNAAVYNFKWAIDQGTDVGAVVKVIRGGDIIPKIVAVVKPVKFKSFPDKKKFGDYEWDANKTHLVLKAKSESKAVLAQKLLRYFVKLKMDKLGISFAEKLVDAGYTKTNQLPHMSLADVAALPGIKGSAKTIHAQLSRIHNKEYSYLDMMVASGVFEKGVGETRIGTLYEVEKLRSLWINQSISAKDTKDLVDKIAEVKGCGPAFAELFVDRLPDFWQWYRDAGQPIPRIDKPKVKKTVTGKLTGEVVTMTGYRDDAEVTALEAAGATIESFGSKTTILLYREGGKRSTKIDKARDKGIRVTTFKELGL